MVASLHVLLPPVSPTIRCGSIKAQPASPRSASPYSPVSKGIYSRNHALAVTVYPFQAYLAYKTSNFTYMQQALSQGNQRTQAHQPLKGYLHASYARRLQQFKRCRKKKTFWCNSSTPFRDLVYYILGVPATTFIYLMHYFQKYAWSRDSDGLTWFQD